MRKDYVEILDKFLDDISSIKSLSPNERSKMVYDEAQCFNPQPSLREINEYLEEKDLPCLNQEDP